MRFSIIHIIVGALVSLWSIYTIKRRILYVSKGKVVKGIVKDIDFKVKSQHHIVEFTDIEDNCKKNIIGRLDYECDLFRYNIGDEIDLIYYKNGTKTKILINSRAYLYYTEIPFLIGGILFFLYGFIGWD
ncbi:hypothetical protein [Tepidibacter hydrothermalis]|uniref:DUF3592 domain-containing protein n=1 Tax=Tepidibacter hydrothermalis TaxID=3036126 RepID=A0ABY8E8Q4_9FIRM|nr:hypothetical protein [Tepidibacter hydrothermalis]WFD09291.1 hypothetical protein P4S50_12950 [Tepidibacter hydrothermalis]